jgi:hypothetical protein
MLCGALRCQKITLSISAALPDRVGNSALVHYINKCQQVSQREKYHENSLLSSSYTWMQQRHSWAADFYVIGASRQSNVDSDEIDGLKCRIIVEPVR